LNAFILGITSDIGREIGHRLDRAGWRVTGTHRRSELAAQLPAHWTLLECDMQRTEQLESLPGRFAATGSPWTLFVSAIGSLEPVGPFFGLPYPAWRESVEINCLAPLHALHGLYPLRAPGQINSVAFFAGAGSNGPAPSYSAYCASKLLLVKMTELLDDETSDLNVFIIGPGMVKTRIHEQTLRAADRAGANLEKVRRFLADASAGVSHDEVFACLEWCRDAGRGVVGGRNIALVSDAWRGGGEALKERLLSDTQVFKLRRFGNDGL
jgi:NAD(P)-dependent dehydrogenase (short-subunit alcohol dehydrogenase family)